MSQAAVEKAIGKLVTDDAFRARFFADPAGASVQAGLELSETEAAALARLPQTALVQFNRRLDDRLCRLCLDAEAGLASAGRGRAVDRPQTNPRRKKDTAPRARKPRAG